MNTPDGNSQHKPQQKINLSMSVQFLKGVGPAKAKLFAKLGIETVADLLEHLPHDWLFTPEPVKMKDLEPGNSASVVALVESTDFQSFRRPAIFEAMVTDDTAACRVIWFHGGYLRNKINVGQTIMLSGKTSLYKHQLQFTNPRFMIIDEHSIDPAGHFGGGVYPACGGLSSGQIKKIIRPILDSIAFLVDEFYEEDFLKKAQLIKRKDAFAWIHLPPDEDKLALAKRRVKYDELFLMQLGLALRRYRTKHFSSATACRSTEKIDRRIRKRFPFLLTADQDTVISEIASDMAKSEPMNRLLQGDVGSGKTVVALYAALLAVANKQQVAIMAPTEILASQHFISIERYLKKSSVTRLLITGGLTGRKRKETLQQIRSGGIDIVAGTVALLQKDVEFRKLGLVIIDEQHKFGVEQRRQLRKGTCPHSLVMTATPIPRTLAMTAFGDLDVSVIKHSPPGRGRVLTRLVDSNDRSKAFEFIHNHLRAGKQAYFVYPRITDSASNGDVKAAVEQYKELSGKVFTQIRAGLLHGQMPSAEKQQVMDEFRKGKIDVLVSTVVIEVGVDVPNATIMVIEGADRFGLAQLHQLRGRICRGCDRSYCLLFAETDNQIAKDRLQVMISTNDGFRIAEHDLKLRGPGELFSTRQHGLPDLKIANIIDDYQLLVMARKNAFKLVSTDPMLTEPSNRNIRRALLAKFGDSLGLVDIA